jgi:N-acetylglucosaminyldiphosphoundecaprenol N-acetyl-beta-D-mannosaminyltransferase
MDKPACVCIASVNNIMQAHDSAEFRRIMNAADLVTPDGMPLVWALRLLGISNASRVYGPDLTPLILAAAEQNGIPVGFYGATNATLDLLAANITKRNPALRIAYRFAPPFRPQTPAEDAKVVQEIGESGARIMFVGLSTPKQEYWMDAHRESVRAVMIGVGAAFDFLAGTKRQAPRWMMGLGLEWLFRLATEPRRLYRRYLSQNPKFLILFTAQVLTSKISALLHR